MSRTDTSGYILHGYERTWVLHFTHSGMYARAQHTIPFFLLRDHIQFCVCSCCGPEPICIQFCECLNSGGLKCPAYNSVSVWAVEGSNAPHTILIFGLDTARIQFSLWVDAASIQFSLWVDAASIQFLFVGFETPAFNSCLLSSAPHTILD